MKYFETLNMYISTEENGMIFFKHYKDSMRSTCYMKIAVSQTHTFMSIKWCSVNRTGLHVHAWVQKADYLAHTVNLYTCLKGSYNTDNWKWTLN